jgi:hypothetical protein
MMKLLPKIVYDLSIQNEAPMPVVIPDIIGRLNIKLSTDDFKTMIQNYIILDRETPEIISHKLYGTMDHHWTILYLNNRFDYVADYPMSEIGLEQYIVDKYGAEHRDTVHHYEDIHGNWTDQYYYDYKNTMGNIPTGELANQPIWKEWYQYAVDQSTTWVKLKTVEAIPVTNYEWESRVNEAKREISVVRPEYITQFVRAYETALKTA